MMCSLATDVRLPFKYPKMWNNALVWFFLLAGMDSISIKSQKYELISVVSEVLVLPPNSLPSARYLSWLCAIKRYL